MEFICTYILLRRPPTIMFINPHSSWEYITTLDFELDIILGRRSYRWTIWVCSDTRFFACRYQSFEIRANLPVR